MQSPPSPWDGTSYDIYRLDAVTEGHVARLPFSLKILLENLLRHADGGDVSAADIRKPWPAGTPRLNPTTKSPSRRPA